MADGQGAWGIDVGQAGLKAIRLKYSDSAKQAMAVAFDYVPHPKILSQPDAIPEQLIPQALETFFSRNETKGDKIAISVPGQTSLAKFIKLPPVESSKVSEIVKYEAKQQIPFDLDDVVWDYQPLGGGIEESGFMLEAEVGLFAMKRDQVMQHLKPFVDAKQEVELIQMSPLALYNFLSYDYMGHREGDELDEGSDEYMIVLDMGADNTTLLVSNGQTIWIRNVPIGGNHFTRALTRDMKLTFAKAEHLKCNATRSPDPKAVFQSLRPVFNDYVSEIQRSIGYFSSVNRDARVKKVLGVGNGFKLAGLQKFLQQNLQYEVERVDSFEGCVGDSVLNAPLFQENIMSFAVPYGLALQGMDVTRIKTSLLPPEIKTARTIRRKKPWAVVAAAGLLGALSLSAFANARVHNSVGKGRFETAEKKVSDLKKLVSDNKNKFENAKSTNSSIVSKGKQLTDGLEKREWWLEVYRAINECLPRDTGDALDEENISKMNRIKLTSITSTKETDFAGWFEGISPQDKEVMDEADQEAPTMPEGSGHGYLFTLTGVHFRGTEDEVNQGFSRVVYIEETILKALTEWELDASGKGEPVPVRKLGITHPVLVTGGIRQTKKNYDPNGSSTLIDRAANAGNNAAGGGAYPGMGGGGGYPGMGMGGGGDDDDEDDMDAMGSGMMGGAGMGGAGMGGGMSSGIGSYPGGAGGGSYPGGATQQGNKSSGVLSNVDVNRQKDKSVTETAFTIQFVWIPTERAKRLEADPRKTAEGDANGGDANGGGEQPAQ